MIDFRYHLVSLVSVFLALAVGLLLGSTVLRPYVQKTLTIASKAEKAEIDSLLHTRDQQQRQITSDNQFAQAEEGLLLRQLLAGQHVVLVVAPGAPDSVTSGVTQALGLAGASVTGQLQLQASFFDTSAIGRQKLTQLAEQVAGKLPAPGLALTGSAQAQASELIANVLMTKDGPGQPAAGQRDSTSAQVINGLANGGFLNYSGAPWDRATLAIVLPPATPPSTNEPNPASQALVTLAQQLSRFGLGTVVAGSLAGSGPGSAIDMMRQGQGGNISSVDDADYPSGQITAVQALYEAMHGRSGSYGVLASANAAAPSPAPSASPSASAGSAAGSKPGAP